MHIKGQQWRRLPLQFTPHTMQASLQIAMGDAGWRTALRRLLPPLPPRRRPPALPLTPRALALPLVAAAAPEEDPVEEGEGEEGEEECEEEEHEEEGEGDSSEEEDRREFGIYQCLPVDDGEPDWGAGEEAQTVEEYLRRVR